MRLTYFDECKSWQGIQPDVTDPVTLPQPTRIDINQTNQ